MLDGSWISSTKAAGTVYQLQLTLSLACDEALRPRSKGTITEEKDTERGSGTGPGNKFRSRREMEPFGEAGGSLCEILVMTVG